MVTTKRTVAPLGTSLKSLVNGFVLTKQTEGKSPRTVEFYSENLKRFLWYASTQDWTDDIRMLTEWHIREFLGYLANEKCRWGLEGNGSETSQQKASHTTVHHYFVVLANFFGWVVREGFLKESPTVGIKVAKPKDKVIKPYTHEELISMLAVCDNDYEHNAKFLGSRNKAIVLVLLDAGVRLSELIGMTLEDINTSNGNIRVMGKGSKERVVRIGKVAQKSLWRYLMHRPDNGRELWLSEEGRPLSCTGVQCLIKRLKNRAGVNGSGSVHRFRHTFALNFLRVDKNVFNLQYLLGHSELEMVKHYVSTLGMEDALKAHEKASPADLLGIK
ncbi:MAG: tyrosine-type recombinase/integrase [Chloroflexi bacterium]|nr:tyrosine-type recombinase/integrase [Chloroflexota bacterium]